MFEPNKHKFSTDNTLITCPVLQNLKLEILNKKQRLTKPPPITRPSKTKYRKLSVKVDLTAKAKLRELALETPEGELDKKLERKILKLIPANLIEQFPQTYEQLFNDVKQEYGKFIKHIGANQKVRADETREEEVFESVIRKKSSQDTLYSYDKFNTIKYWLNKRLFITTPLIRKIHNMCQATYRETLFNFESYRSGCSSIQVAVLRAKIREDVEAAKVETLHYVCKQTNLLIMSRKYLHFVESELFGPYARSVNHYLSLNVMQCLYRTIQHFVHTLDYPAKIPLLKFHLAITNELDVVPSFAQLSQFYHGIVDIVATHHVELFEMKQFHQSEVPKKINIQVPDYLTDWAHQKIEERLNFLTQPLKSHIKTIEDSYQQFWNEEFVNNFKMYCNTHTFEECCTKYDELQDVHQQITQLYPYEYFEIGILEQIGFIGSLQRRVNLCVNNLFESLVQSNFRNNFEIHEEFKDIALKAAKVPQSTEELVELGVFMQNAKFNRIQELNNSMKDSLLQSVVLLGMTEITSDHINLNSKTIKWTRNIQTIIDKNTNMFEQKKNEFEEELQKQIDELIKDVLNFACNLQILDDMSDCRKAITYIPHLKVMQMKLEVFDKRQKWINHEESLFKFPPSVFADLDDCKDIIYTFANLVFQCHKWLRTYSIFMDGPWEYLTYEDVNEVLNKYKSSFLSTQKMYIVKIRQQIVDGVARRFKGQVDDPDFHNHPAPLKLCAEALKYVVQFEPRIEIIRILCNPALLQRHWDEMSEVIGRDITPTAGTTLHKVIKEELEPFLPQFDIISIAAMKELKLQQNLQAMQKYWTEVRYETTPWKENENIHILTNLNYVFTILDDHLIETLRMRASVFVKPIETDVKLWYDKLNLIQSQTKSWFRAQNNWLKLIPIFSCEYIIKEVPKESNLFSQVDNHLITYLEFVNGTRIVTTVVENENLRNILIEARLLLDKIIRGLASFIETKRMKYPRFYFLSNNQVLEALSFSKKFNDIVPYVKKCFTSVYKVEFKVPYVIGVESSIGEKIVFSTPVNYEDCNIWVLFIELEEQIKITIKEGINKSLQDIYFLTKIKWWSKWPEKVIINALKINWTKECETCLGTADKSTLKNYQTALTQQLNELILYICSKQSNLVVHSLKSIYVQTMYFIQIIDWLLKNHCARIDSFYWLIQFRYYWSDKNYRISIFNIDKFYQFEYLGNDEILVQTPDTERCYRTFVQASQFHLYACLETAEISGKSVIFKDLAGIYGQPYYSHNCKIPLNYEQLLRMIKGTVACGAYFCFDDFNYTDAGIKSVLAQYLTNILDANKYGVDNLFSISIKPYAQFGITFTQTSKFCLPNNLKVLFRHFYLSTPDERFLIETTLAKHGFKDYKNLAMRFSVFWKYCKVMFHNINTRCLNKILMTAGKSSGKNETEIIVSSIFNVLLPMFDQDIRFKFIVNDFFEISSDNLTQDLQVIDVIKTYCEKEHITLSDTFLSKLLQLYWIYQNFKNIIITGDEGSGKSIGINFVKSIFNIEVIVIYPSLLSVESIFGDQTENLEQFSNISDHIYNESGCYIFDGPITNQWFNYLKPNVTNIFETININEVSPNIISNCGVVHFSSITWEVLIPKYLPNNPLWGAKYAQILPELLKWLIPPCFKYIHTNCNSKNFTNETNIIRAVMMQTMLIIEEAANDNLEDIKYISSWIQATVYSNFLFNIWNILDETASLKFDKFYKSLWKSHDKIDFTLPTEGLSIDYYYIYKSKGVWKYWPDMIRSPKIEEINLDYMIVPTIHSARLNVILELYLRNKQSFILIGNTGSGKTCYMNHLLKNKLPKDCEKTYIHIARKMSSTETLKLYLSKLIKHKRNKFGANLNKKLYTFIDDLHLSITDGYAPTTELIRQYLDYNFWYEENEKEELFINDLMFLCNIGFIGNQTPKICKRFLNHFTIFLLPDIQNESLQKIFTCKLFHSFKANGFPSDIINSSTNIVQATQYIYEGILTKLKPLPCSILYIFQLTDFQKVISGCSLLKKGPNVNKKTFPKLWLHEMLRTFYDRLVNTEDQLWFQNEIIYTLSEYFKEDFKALFQNDDITEIISDLYFNKLQNQYEEININEYLQTILTELDNYNNKNDVKLNIVLQKYSIQHLLHISRILSFNGGCGLLIGSYGSGRETLTRLAAFILNYDMFTPTTQPEYNIKDWRRDIRNVLLHVGSTGRKTILLIKECYLKNEQYLNDLNSLLTLGEIQNMYTVEEQQIVLESTRIAAQEGNRSADVSVAQVLQFYINRCKQNLHLMICLSSNTQLSEYLRIYPALINICIMDYFKPWPATLYEKIAEFYLKPLNFRKPEVKPQLPNIFRIFNTTINDLSSDICAKTNRYNFITSASFIHFLKCYQYLIDKKQNEIMTAQQKYQTGLNKLSFATDQVVLLQEELSNLKPQLIEMGERAASMRKVIEHETIAVETASQLVREEEKVANVQAAAAQSLKSECEADLALAIPILEDAISALNTLKPTDITLVKSMKNPPDTIKLVMAAVCVIKEIKPDRLPDAATGKKIIDYWGPSKRILGEMNFLQQLKEFDKDNIPPNVMQKIRKEYLPNKDFQPHTVAKASSAAEGLCKWVIAMDLYDKVAKEVAPKKAKLVIAENKYANTLSILNEKRRKFSELKARLEDLNIKLEEANKDMKRLQIEVDNCTRKYQCAQKLVNSLEFEKSYWTDTVNALTIAYDDLTGDVLVSASIIAYLGPFSWKNREIIFEKLNQYLIDMKIDFSNQFNFARLLKQKNETRVINYAIRNITTDNITIIQNSKRCCLLVDPQLQMLNWIQEIEKNLKIVKISDPNILDKLIDNVINGIATVVSNIENDIDQSLFPFLQYDRIYERDGKRFLEVNHKDVQYHDNFRLYLTTSLPNPLYSEQVSHYVSVIYCPITKFTLTDKLLNILVSKENNDLFIEHRNVSLKMHGYKLALKDVRYNILTTLSESKSNILDDETAIETLDNSKIQLSVIQADQLKTSEFLNNLEESIKSYKPTAVYGATIYKCLLSLYHLNYLYQYSLNWYENLFQISIAKASKSRSLDTRMRYLREYLAKAVYYNISRSLFSRHSLIFTFFLYIHTVVLKDKRNDKLFKIFINKVNLDSKEVNTNPEWLRIDIWKQIVFLSENFTSFIGLDKSMIENSEWEDLCTSKSSKIPNDWINKLNLFEQLILIKTLKPEQVVSFVKYIIGIELGAYFTKTPLFDIGKTYQASVGSYVIVIILPEENNYQNPVSEIRAFAKKMGLANRFKTVSLGTNDQTILVEQLIRKDQSEEYWVCIENVHLSLDWVNTKLELLCEQFNTTNTNNNFRLWLITTYTPSENALSSFILQNSTKVTIDQEIDDLKEVLISNYNNHPINDDVFYNKCPGYDKIFQRAIFMLCYFYGVLKIRQNYKNYVWSSSPLISFDVSDLHMSLFQVAKYIQIYNELPIDIMEYLTISCNYGAKIQTGYDRKSISSIFNSIFNPEAFNNDLYSCFNNQREYRIPKKLEFCNVLKHLDSFPSPTLPDLFYLQETDNREYNLHIFKSFVQNVYLIKNIPLQSNIENRLAVIETLISEIPDEDLLKQMQTKYYESTDRIEIIIYSELLHFEQVVSKIKTDLIQVLAAISGDLSVTENIQHFICALQKNLIPSEWNHLIRLSKNTSITYLFRYLKAKFEFFNSYQPNQLDFFLPAFQYPKQLFLALSFSYSKKLNTTVDSLVIQYCDSDEIFNISGLSCVGACWNTDAATLEKIESDANIIHEIPKIKFSIIQTQKDELDTNFYEFPLFQTVENSFEADSNFVWKLELPVQDKETYSWMIKRNVFLLCHP